jgi:LPXTG-motif cell wall-anchored protein
MGSAPDAASGWLTALGIPALLALGGFIAWFVRSTIDDYRDAERQLAAERRALYQRVLASIHRFSGRGCLACC